MTRYEVINCLTVYVKTFLHSDMYHTCEETDMTCEERDMKWVRSF